MLGKVLTKSKDNRIYIYKDGILNQKFSQFKKIKGSGTLTFFDKFFRIYATNNADIYVESIYDGDLSAYSKIGVSLIVSQHSGSNPVLPNNLGFTIVNSKFTEVATANLNYEITTNLIDTLSNTIKFRINSWSGTTYAVEISKIWLEKSGGGVIDYLSIYITFLRKALADMLGRVIGVGSKSIYPAGYKYKRGNILETTTIMTISENIIPLTIQLNGSSGGALNYALSLDANPVKNIFSFSGYGTGNYNGGGSFGTTFINLLALYNFDFDELKLVKTITENVSFRSGSMSRTSFKIVEWLEKVDD